LAGREAILRVHAKNVRMAESLDFSAIAKATPGASGAQLANIINEAALHAVRNGRGIVAQADLEECVEIVLAGYKKKNKILTLKEKSLVAYHEMGHAIVAATQKNTAPVSKITIIPRTSGALGYTMQVDENERFLMDQQELEARIVTLTGGRAAEELMFGTVTTGASNDIEQATKLARAMVTRYGMSEAFGLVALEAVNNPYLGTDTELHCSDETAARIDEEVMRIISGAYVKAKEILQANMHKLRELSQILMEKETMMGDEFSRLLQSGAANPPVPSLSYVRSTEG
jgi:cell division protease FtsH